MLPSLEGARDDFMTQVDYGDPRRVFGGDLSILNGSSNCVVIFHGYSDTPYEFKDVAKEISLLGVDVIVPVLPHHGIDSMELFKANRAEAHDWGVQLITRLKSSYEKIIILGHSMGSGIVFHAVLEGAPIDGLIVTSVNGVPSKKVRFFLQFAKFLHVRSFKTMYKSLHDIHFEPEYIKWKLAHFPRIWFNVFFDAIESLPSYITRLHEITAPILVIHGAKDFATNVGKTSALYFNNVSSSKKITVIVERTGHDIFFSTHFSKIMQEIKAFIQDVLEHGNEGELVKRITIR
jgi:esterase/lipase